MSLGMMCVFRFSRMEVQRAAVSGVAMPTDGDNLLQWILQMWLLILLGAFAAGAMCWRQCCSRLGHKAVELGELDSPPDMPWEDNSFSSPPSSRRRRRQSPTSLTSRRSKTSKGSSNKSSSKSSRPKNAFNKQPVVDEGGTTSWAPTRGRPSAMDRGRKVLSVMENFATGTSPNPGREANP